MSCKQKGCEELVVRNNYCIDCGWIYYFKTSIWGLTLNYLEYHKEFTEWQFCQYFADLGRMQRGWGYRKSCQTLKRYLRKLVQNGALIKTDTSYYKVLYNA